MTRMVFKEWYNHLPESVRNNILRALRGDFPMTQDALLKEYGNYGLTAWKITQLQHEFGFNYNERNDNILRDKASGMTNEEIMKKYGIRNSELKLILTHTRVDNTKSVELF